MANSDHLSTYMIWAPGYDEVPLGKATAGLIRASMRHLKNWPMNMKDMLLLWRH